jgi:hypothetical protein
MREVEMTEDFTPKSALSRISNNNVSASALVVAQKPD